jgi:iron complex outermembrane receptor protein
MLNFKRNLLSVALASATLMAAAGAHAQTAQEPAPAGDPANDQGDEAVELDRVRVTGIRRGIENAIEVKQSSTSIVEAISAEDIGKLPDLSIAESIARLPGLTAQRVAGRASTIQIRGLADDFGTTLLNGREQVSVGHNRGVEFDQYPSELINGVVVYKTPDASLVGQGLSGTVDLQTVRPLSFPDRVISFNLRGEENSQGELNPGYDDRGYRVSGSYIDQFLDNTLGIALGYARLDSPGQANRWESYGYPNDYPGFEGISVLGGTKSQVSSTENIRDGLMGVIEFKPNDTYHTVLDLYYSKFEKSETLRFLEAGLGWGDRPQLTLTNAVVEDGAMVSGTFSGVRPVIRNDRNTQDDKIFAAGWNNKFTLGEKWTLVGDVSYSKAEREEELLETYSGLGHKSNPLATDTVDFTLDRSTGLGHFTFGEDYTDPSNIVLTDPGGWGQDGFLKRPRVEDELKSFRINAERSFDTGIFSSVELGLNRADRDKTRYSGLEAFLRLPGSPGAEVPIPSECLGPPADLDFTGVPGSIGYDIDCVFAGYTIDPHSHQDIANKNWTVNEKLTTAYVQWNINTDLGSIPMRGNVGFQAVRTDQSSVGSLVPFGEADAPIPLSGGAEYTDFLPSLNLSFSLPHDQMLRFALGQQMARPRMDDLRANQNVSINTTVGEWQGDGGNPELEPWRATALDISYEKYFGGRGYVSLAGFHKDLHTWIGDEVVLYDFSGYDSGDATRPESDIGFFRTKTNRNGGKIYGFEFAVSVPFDMVWEPLEGFGFQGSYSNTHSEVRPGGPGTPVLTLPGLSKEVSNLTFYYERYGFSARVSQRKRSPFLGEVQGFGGDRSPRFIRGEEVIDFQLGYAFADGTSLEGLSILLQVNNANNEPYREFFPEFSNLPRYYSEYGRQVLLGATYKF